MRRMSTVPSVSPYPLPSLLPTAYMDPVSTLPLTAGLQPTLLPTASLDPTHSK